MEGDVQGVAATGFGGMGTIEGKRCNGAANAPAPATKQPDQHSGKPKGNTKDFSKATTS